MKSAVDVSLRFLSDGESVFGGWLPIAPKSRLAMIMLDLYMYTIATCLVSNHKNPCLLDKQYVLQALCV